MEQFCQTEKGLRVLAPAKINLTLLIAGKRPDGFHDIETVMAKIDYCDELLFEPADSGEFELRCTGPQWAPDGPDNLIWKAATLLENTTGKKLAVRTTLCKNIPAGSGLGSASSDAAAALMGLNRYFKLGLTTEQLTPLAASLGSDVVFFLGKSLAFCTGRGEKISPIAEKFSFRAFLVTTNINTSTKKVYENYAHSKDVYLSLSEQINSFLSKNRVDLAAKICANMLAESCFRLHPELARLRDYIHSLTGKDVCLSGSGSAMYCLLDTNDVEHLECWRDRLRNDLNCESRLVYNNSW